MATSQVETVTTAADKLKLAVAVVLAVAAFAGFYLLAAQGPLAQWGALVLGLALAVGAFASSESGRQLWAFGRDSWREVKKVVWPERREAMQVTAYVFVFVTIMAIFLWTTDKTVEWLFYDLLLGWRK